METTEEKKCCETKKCGCFYHMMPGVLIILIGVTILLGALDVITNFKTGAIIISILIILLGLSKLCPGFCKCCDKT